ncbi:hypothetical protein FEP76_02919 [Burkholderia multivorans]|nr:hypothetical protein [Burkholderia multivorans]
MVAVPALVDAADVTTGDAAAIAEPFEVASWKPSSAPRVGSTVNWSPACIVPDDTEKSSPPIEPGIVFDVPTTEPVARSVSVYCVPSNDSV